MSRLIDADRLNKCWKSDDEVDLMLLKAIVDAQPTIELTDKVQDIEVVQCKNCEYYMDGHCWNDLINADMIIEPNWFCGNAVRKDYDDCRN